MSRFIICRASAGSGKTYTLVRQFIETAISSPSQLEQRFEHILAITFTNKAANGMKERIMSQLHDITNGGAEGLCEEIAEHLSITIEEVRRRCKVAQTAILHHYSELSVCTIDSFVHRLVRTFAHDLRLPMNFDVMIDNQQIVQTTVDDLLALAGTEGQESLTKMLCVYTQSRMDSGKSYRLESQIAELAKEIFKEESPRFLAELEKVSLDDYIEIHKWLRDECRGMEKQLTSAAKELTVALQNEGLTIDDFPYKKSGALGFFLRLAEGDYSKLNDSHKRSDDSYTGNLWGSKTPADIKSHMEKLTPTYRRVYETITGILDKQLTAYNSRQLLLANLFGLALLSQLNQIKNAYYKENEIVHISEFSKRISEEVMNEPTPFIYERIGSRYYNYMIDEFQDTSRLQWSNFLPLLDEAMTHQFSADTAQPGTQSLVVGDGKQAIYRFRQGDVRQFMMLPQVESRLHGHSLADNADVVPLSRNFRTLSNIVEFNNRFFESIIRNQFADNPELTKLYIGNDTETDNHADLRQEPVKKGGYVQVSFSAREDIFKNILDTIRHQVDDLGYSYGDIMILARDNDTLVKIADYITENGERIPLVSSESFLLSGSREVLMVQSLLEYIYDPRNRVAALQALRMYDAGCMNDDVEQTSSNEWMLKDHNYDLASVINELIPREDGRRTFDVEYLRTLSLYDLCETLIRIFNLDGKGNRYLATFMNVVNNFSQKGHADLGEFIKYLSEKIDRLSSATATDLDAVQLMTIHKAKGLEAKIVLFALPNKRSPNNQMWVEVKNESIEDLKLPVAFVGIQKNSTVFEEAFSEEYRLTDMDRINVLYVAMTRPEEKLFVFCEDAKTSEDSTSNIALLRDFVKGDSKTEQRDKTMAVYSVGEDFASHRMIDKESNNQTIKITSILSPEWESRVSIAQQSAALLSPLDEDNRRYGILIHDLLSHIRVAEDVDGVVENYCKENKLTDAVRDDIRKRIISMISKEENRRFFADDCRVKCEASIAVNGKVKRPDRIVFTNEKTYVVDFKTGARDEQSHRKYLRQVTEYAEALSVMGYLNVEPVIVYL